MFFLRNNFFPMALILSASLMALPGLAAQQGNGVVNMQGAIVDTACSIEAGDRDQSINMGSFPLAVIASTGKSPVREFSIRLTDCVLERSSPLQPDWKKFQVTFEGSLNGALFSLEGKASGVGLRISDAAGRVAAAGAAIPADRLNAGTMHLHYYLQLIRNNQPLVAGDYSTTLRFKLDYF